MFDGMCSVSFRIWSFKLQFVLVILLHSPVLYSVAKRTNGNSRFTIEDLLTSTFPKKISGDLDLDPCKAGTYWFASAVQSIPSNLFLI